MSTASIPVLSVYNAPTAPLRWVTGSASVALAIGRALLTTMGYQTSQGANGAFGEAWQGAMFAVFSIAAAVTGLACGGVDATLGRGDRTLSLLGVIANLGFGAMFYTLWF